VALQATPSDIAKAFFFVMLDGFIPVMALEAIHRGTGPIVAARALAVGIAVAHGE
jgi:hypothetical protein